MYGGACVRGLCRGDLGMLKKNKTQVVYDELCGVVVNFWARCLRNDAPAG